MLARFIFKTFNALSRLYVWSLNCYYKQTLNIHPSVRLGMVKLDPSNIEIGKYTYIQSGEIFSGSASVKIGKYCAIGSNVSIKARTHDLSQPTADEQHSVNARRCADIMIGDHVWIGDNVFIREGVTIGNDAVIAANSVVVKDVGECMIVGGVPARAIRKNDQLQRKA